jgi:hypothetical protein
MGKKSRRRDKNTTTVVQPQTQTSQHQHFSYLPTETIWTTPYVVKRNDFLQLPRWPNDGIEQEKRKNLAGGPDSFGRIETDDPDTIAMTELLGGYPSKSPLCQLKGDGAHFIRTLPFIYQEKAKEQQSDLSSAKLHLIEAYRRKDLDVFMILQDINCEKVVYKASRDESQLASDTNIELLFGKVSHVRHLLLEMGSQMADPPPVNSPAGDYFAQFLYGPEIKVRPVPKSCAECGFVSDDIGRLGKCSACRCAAYCGTGMSSQNATRILTMSHLTSIFVSSETGLHATFGMKIAPVVAENKRRPISGRAFEVKCTVLDSATT